VEDQYRAILLILIIIEFVMMKLKEEYLKSLKQKEISMDAIKSQ